MLTAKNKKALALAGAFLFTLACAPLRLCRLTGSECSYLSGLGW